MEFPDEFVLLEEFGLEQVDIDPNMAYVCYRKSDADSALEMDLSFSEVDKSFQIVMRCMGRELAVVSSERLSSIWIERDEAGSKLRIKFDISGVAAEAMVRTEPSIYYHWWTIED